MSRDSRNQVLDAGIIDALKNDGRASIQEIAASLGEPRGAVSVRLKALLDSGAVRVFAAFDHGFAGQNVLVHSMVKVRGTATEVAQHLASYSETVFVSLVTGTHSLVFESRHADMHALQTLLKQVRDLPGVESIESTLYADVIRGFFVAHYRDNVTIDTTDLTLIAQLQEDGRVSFREMAEKTGLAPSSVRSRVSRLISQNVIRISAVESRTDSNGRLSMGVGITARGDDSQITDFLLKSSQIDFSVQTIGRYDFIATATGSSTLSLHNTLEKIRALPAVTNVETWSHLTVLKEDYERTVAVGTHNTRTGG
ncbi:MAG: Lrp/AsnC family transcriptional regulator [Canibacter sp.]